MNRRMVFGLIALLLAAMPLFAQPEGLNLPTDLYVLLNEGIVQRYGIGAAGIRNITPENVFVIDFGISADGERIAYRTQEALMIATTNGEGEPLTADTNAGIPPTRGQSDTVAWSPSGHAIAYTTLEGAKVYYTDLGVAVSLTQPGLVGVSWSPDGRYLVAEAQHNIWWIYRISGAAPILQAAIPSSIGTTWANESQLAFAPADGGLILMNLDAANQQTVLLDDSAEYRLPVLAPDNRLYFFQRNKDDAEVPEGFGQLVALAPGAEALDVIGTTAIDLNGLRWSPGAMFMVLFEGNVLALFDAVSGLGQPLPINSIVAYDWGTYPPRIDVQATQPTPEAIFPDQFPTLDPATMIPGVLPPTAEATETAVTG